MFQQSQHIRRLIAAGVNAPGFVGVGAQTQRVEPAQRVGTGHSVQQSPQDVRGSGNIVRWGQPFVIQIAAAIAGGQQLFADAGVAFQHRDAGGRVRLGRREGRGQPRRAAAQNQDMCHAGTCLSCRSLVLL